MLKEETLVKTYGSIIVGLLVGLFVYACIDDPLPSPKHCYVSTIVTSSITGEVLSQKTEFTFVFEEFQLEKWERDQGVTVTRDTIRHEVTIRLIQCIEPDIKQVPN